MPKILCKHKNTNNVNDSLKRDKNRLFGYGLLVGKVSSE